jgi:hypothetical protein
MSNYTLTARHAGVGRVTFTFENCADKKAAFERFKSTVYSHKQWIVERNEQDGAPAPVTAKAQSVLSPYYLDD